MYNVRLNMEEKKYERYKIMKKNKRKNNIIINSNVMIMIMSSVDNVSFSI